MSQADAPFRRTLETTTFLVALLGFAAHFVPAVQEGALRTGLLRGQGKKKRGFFRRR